MRILHIASHTINVGDGAIHKGILLALSQILGDVKVHALDHVAFDFAEQVITKKEIEEVNPGHIIIGGGGTIDGHENSLSGTSVPIHLDTLREIDIPVTFLSLGYNLFYGQTNKSLDQLKQLLDICKEKQWGFSLRDDGSKERMLADLGEDADKYSGMIDVLPDPGLFIKKTAVTEGGVPVLGDYIVVQLSSDNILTRLGNENKATEFVSQIREFIMGLIQRGIHVVFALHTHEDITSLLNVYMDMPVSFVRYGTTFTGFMAAPFADTFFNYYDKAMMVIGMRGHSVICGIGMGKPAIAISTHPKVESMMRDMGLSEFCLDPLENTENIKESLEHLTYGLLSGNLAYPDKSEFIEKEWVKFNAYLSNELIKSMGA